MKKKEQNGHQKRVFAPREIRLLTVRSPFDIRSSSVRFKKNARSTERKREVFFDAYCTCIYMYLRIQAFECLEAFTCESASPLHSLLTPYVA